MTFEAKEGEIHVQKNSDPEAGLCAKEIYKDQFQEVRGNDTGSVPTILT